MVTIRLPREANFKRYTVDTQIHTLSIHYHTLLIIVTYCSVFFLFIWGAPVFFCHAQKRPEPMAPETLAQPKVTFWKWSSDSYEIRWMNIQLNPTEANNQLFFPQICGLKLPESLRVSRVFSSWEVTETWHHCQLLLQLFEYFQWFQAGSTQVAIQFLDSCWLQAKAAQPAAQDPQDPQERLCQFGFGTKITNTWKDSLRFCSCGSILDSSIWMYQSD